MALVVLGRGVSLAADHWSGADHPNVALVLIGTDDERVPFTLSWKAENDNPALRRFISISRIVAREYADASV